LTDLESTGANIFHSPASQEFMMSKSAYLLAIFLLLWSCGDEGQRPPPGAAPPTAPEPGPWFVVDPQALDAIEGERILWNAPGAGPPVILEKREPELPSGHRALSSESSLIIRVVLTRTGHIAKAQLLRGPADRETKEAIAAALRHWRLRPVVVRGEAENVYWNLTLLPRERAKSR
jgi:hypothetical protein